VEGDRVVHPKAKDACQREGCGDPAAMHYGMSWDKGPCRRCDCIRFLPKFG
jgi:hypothetical protein